MKLLVVLLLPYLSLSEVVPNFHQSPCVQFFSNNDPPQFTPPLGSQAHICQCVLDNNSQRKYIYATLYNTAWKIPIYSAYVFGSPNIGRCDAWYVEPQLDGDTEKCMKPRGHTNATGNNQAMNSDYDNSGYDKGHLYPVQHTNNHLSMLATSTLTNAAPQHPQFNRAAWKVHEQDVITDLQLCFKTFVVTGVVPNTNIKINNRVTVSKYYWRATCCQNGLTFIGKGFYGPDKKGKVKSLSIINLQTQLAKDYNVNYITIFPSLPIIPGSKRPISDCN